MIKAIFNRANKSNIFKDKTFKMPKALHSKISIKMIYLSQFNNLGESIYCVILPSLSSFNNLWFTNKVWNLLKQ